MAAAGTRPTAIAVLTTFYGVGSVLCLLGALRPIDDDTPVDLLAAIGIIGGLTTAVIWWVGGFLDEPVIHAALGAVSLVVGVLAANTVTQPGTVSLGPVLICIGLYAAHFCSIGAARLHVTTGLVFATAGMLIAVPAPILALWFVNVVAAILVTELQARLVRRLRESASVDPLTGLSNRRAWFDAADRAVAEAERRRGPLTVVILDLDDFKAVNDEGGHPAGDQLLRDLAAAWTTQLRRYDALGRYGGDEFALLLPGTDLHEAGQVLSRMVTAHPAVWSAGTTTWRHGDTSEDLVHRADVALYEQKVGRMRNGRTGRQPSSVGS